MVGMFVSFLCLASENPSEREFFVPAGMHLGVKLLITIFMLIHTINRHASSFRDLLANFAVVLPFTLHAANRRQAGDDCCEAAPPIMVVHPPFCRVAARWIRAKNTGHLRERPIVTSGMIHHVMLEEANSAAIDPISHPNRSNRRLLPPPLNHELHLTTTSGSNTSPQLAGCSSHERPWSPASVPTISTTMRGG